MGLSLLVNEKEIELGNAVHLNNFMNEISMHGDFPELMHRSFSEGEVLYNYVGKPTLLVSGVVNLYNECKRVKGLVPLTIESEYILNQFMKACRESIRSKKDIEII